MGFFSFKTTDTNESIPNRHSDKDTFTVYMVDIDNNIYTEKDYDGYGIFGGKDFFELLSKMNGYEGRDVGIDLFLSDEPCIYPNLMRHKPIRDERENYWKKIYSVKSCEHQGFFY